MHSESIRSLIASGQCILGIELGSTRIKAVLIDPAQRPVASSSVVWENQYLDGIWTYSLEQIRDGLQACYRGLVQNVQDKYSVSVHTFAAIGISGMMHGYFAFDRDGGLLVPFRTWRNTTTARAADALSALFHFNIPQRWSIAHLYQAILDGEPHVPQIRTLTTLSGYVHWMLTGNRVLGVGDASGMFPIASGSGSYDQKMLDLLNAELANRRLPWTLEEILPRVLRAGTPAGVLTREGALFLDPTGALQPGIPLCPPEGDAGTGMTATNSVTPRSGNISAGTSIFSMVVLERPLSRPYPEIDLVTTPDGAPVAMIHCNNCTSELNAWAGMLHEVLELFGIQTDLGSLLTVLTRHSLQGEPDCGGITAYNYEAGEPIAGLNRGCPLTLRRPGNPYGLANFMRAQLYSAIASLCVGMELLSREHVRIDRMLGHGGLFKTPQVCQQYLASALQVPVSVMDTAGEGGAWGIALLAGYMVQPDRNLTLGAYLEDLVFSGMQCTVLSPDPETASGFQAFLTRYRSGLALEQTVEKEKLYQL